MKVELMKAELHLTVNVEEADEGEIYRELIRFCSFREGVPEVRCSYAHLNETIHIVARMGERDNYIRSESLDEEYLRESARKAITMCRELKRRDDDNAPILDI